MATSAKTATYARRQHIGTLALVGVADIFEASELHTQAKRAIADAKALTVRINLARAERLDTSTLQILFALHRELTEEGRVCVLDDASPALARTLALAGFHSPL